MLEEQIDAKKRRDEQSKERKRQEDAIERARIQKMNDMLELRKIEEDQKLKRSMMMQQQANQKAADNYNIQVRAASPPSKKINLPSKIEDISLAESDLLYTKNRIKQEIENDLYEEKEFMKRLPGEIKKKIQATLNTELQRLKNEVNHGSNVLREEVLRLRSIAVELDEEKRKAKDDLQKLRSNLAKIQYEDDIRTHELLDALAEDNINRLLPSSTMFSMPEALFKDDRDLRFPVSYYDEDRLVKGEKKLYNDGYFEDFGGWEVGRESEDLVLERNNERKHVYDSILDGQPLFEL